MKRCALSIVILLSIAHQSSANTGLPKQCYPDAISAYEALTKYDRTHAKIININTASAAELTSLTGIGHTTAAAIVEYRKANGSFGSVDELLYVKGIGAATLNKNRHRLSVMSR